MDETKPWYQSRAIIGALVAILAGLLSLFGIDLSDIDQAELTTLAMNLFAIGGGLLAFYGRVKATKQVRFK